MIDPSPQKLVQNKVFLGRALKRKRRRDKGMNK
jgi:hypothetical protein